MMKSLLAIDSSANQCRIGLMYKGEHSETIHEGFKDHAKVMLGLVDSILANSSITLANLDGIVYGHGPGSFTGLRIAACVTQGLAISHQLPVCGISSLQALAQRVFNLTSHNNIWILNDARMNEVYHARYIIRDDIAQIYVDDNVSPIENIDIDVEQDWLLAGSGLDVYSNQILKSKFNNFKQSQVRAFNTKDLIDLALAKPSKFCQTGIAIPAYIRNKVANKSNKTISNKT